MAKIHCGEPKVDIAGFCNEVDALTSKCKATLVTLCKNCQFICKPTGALYEPHPESICLSPDTIRVNFVTGIVGAPLCKNINTAGKCEFFKQRNDQRFV